MQFFSGLSRYFCQPALVRRWRGALVLAVTLTLAACGGNKLTPEDELRAFVDDCQALAEEKSWRALNGCVAPSYSDARGNDRQQLMARLRAATLGVGALETIINVDKVDIFGDDAGRLELTLRFVSVGERLRSLEAGSYRLSLDMAKVSGEWQVYAARWGRNERDMR